MRQSVDEAVKLLPAPGKIGFRRGDAKPGASQPTASGQNSTEHMQELEVELPRHPNSGKPPFDHDAHAQSTHLPPPRSPQHSPIDPTKPAYHPNGRPIQRFGEAEPTSGNGQDKDYARLLERYNFRTRDGGNGHGY
jgi:hypothetical protein